MTEPRYTMEIKPGASGWFWHVARDWRNGQGWHGLAHTAQEAHDAAARAMAQAIQEAPPNV